MEDTEFVNVTLAEMNDNMKSNHAKATKQEEMLAEISARITINLKEMEVDRKRDREDLKGMIEEMNAKMDAGPAEMRSTVCAMRSELKETLQHEMKAIIQLIRLELDETTVCNEATETEPHPGMVQSIEEHQEMPKGDAAVMPVGGSRKRRRFCNLAAERRHKMRERARGNSGSRRKLAAAYRKVSRREKMAWRKRNIIRKIRIQVSRESRKELAVACTERCTVQTWHSAGDMIARDTTRTL
jgi:hypothetical protein